MLHKLLQSFNVDVVITAICIGNQCFISASVFFSLKPQSLSVAPLFVWNNLFTKGHKEDSRRESAGDANFSRHCCQKCTFVSSLVRWVLSCESNLRRLAPSCKMCPRWWKQLVHNLAPSVPPATIAVLPYWDGELSPHSVSRRPRDGTPELGRNYSDWLPLSAEDQNVSEHGGIGPNVINVKSHLNNCI